MGLEVPVRCCRIYAHSDPLQVSPMRMTRDELLLLRAGHTYVILVILSKRKAIMRYRVLRPNNIFQPLVAAHMLKSNYKKV